jgi:hypothetical protein
MTPEQYNLKELEAGRLTAGQIVEMVAFWQQGHGLPVDGKAGERTRASIEATRESVPAPVPTVPVTGHPEPPTAPPPLIVDEQGWLRGEAVVHVPSVRSSPLDADLDGPAAIVWHYTSTDAGTADALARRIAKAPGPEDREVSWNILIAQDGRILQSISCERGAWHAGGATAKQLPLAGKQRRPNRSTVGIELEGHGASPLPPAQAISAGRVLRAIGATYGIKPRDLVWTHAEIDPSRRSDPGPHWVTVLQDFAGAGIA